MLNTKVKASRVANLTDARYFSAWEVDWLGFCLDPASDSYVDPKNMMAMRGWLEGPAIVGEFGVATIEEIKEAYKLLDLDMVQLGPFQGANVLELLEGIPLIKEIIVDSFSEDRQILAICEACAPFVKFLILDFERNGISWAAIKQDEGFRLGILKEICRKKNVLLSLEMKGTEILEVLEVLKPYGLSFSGGSEEKVGYKSFDELDELFEEIEVQI